MKNFAAAIGILTIAQWVFVGLLHVFLGVQHKKSPETLNRLHDVPVIGGYFRPVQPENPIEKLSAEAAERNLRIVEAKEIFDLPEAFDLKDLEAMAEEIRSRKSELSKTRIDLDEKSLSLSELEKEIERRETLVAANQVDLEKKANEINSKMVELEAERRRQSNQASEAESVVLKKLAKIYGEIEPTKAAELLHPADDIDGPKMSADEKALAAAKILAYMEPERSAKVLEVMNTVDAVRVGEKMKSLTSQK